MNTYVAASWETIGVLKIKAIGGDTLGWTYAKPGMGHKAPQTELSIRYQDGYRG